MKLLHVYVGRTSIKLQNAMVWRLGAVLPFVGISFIVNGFVFVCKNVFTIKQNLR